MATVLWETLAIHHSQYLQRVNKKLLLADSYSTVIPQSPFSGHCLTWETFTLTIEILHKSY